jgi:uncharacterized membrane protein
MSGVTYAKNQLLVRTVVGVLSIISLFIIALTRLHHIRERYSFLNIEAYYYMMQEGWIVFGCTLSTNLFHR